MDVPPEALSEVERELLLAADEVIDHAEAALAEAVASGDEEHVRQRTQELQVAFEWATVVRQEILAGMKRAL